MKLAERLRHAAAELSDQTTEMIGLAALLQEAADALTPRKTLRAAIVAALQSYPLTRHGQPLTWTVGRDARVRSDGELGPLADHLAERVERWMEGGGK